MVEYELDSFQRLLGVYVNLRLSQLARHYVDVSIITPYESSQCFCVNKQVELKGSQSLYLPAKPMDLHAVILQPDVLSPRVLLNRGLCGAFQRVMGMITWISRDIFLH